MLIPKELGQAGLGTEEKKKCRDYPYTTCKVNPLAGGGSPAGPKETCELTRAQQARGKCKFIELDARGCRDARERLDAQECQAARERQDDRDEQPVRRARRDRQPLYAPDPHGFPDAWC